MNLKTLSDILSEKNREYEIAHSRVIRALNLDQDETTVASYVTLIKNDIAEWIRLTPLNNTKPKTAMLYLLEKCDMVRDAIGEEECKVVANALRSEWKRLRKEYTNNLDATQAASDADNRNEDDTSHSCDANKSDHSAYIISLQTRLKFLQGVIEDIVKPGVSDADKLQAVVSRMLFYTDLESEVTDGDDDSC